MFEFLNYGEKLLELVRELGAFFVETPGGLAYPYFNIVEGTIDYITFPWPFGSIGSWIFGAGVVFLVTYRLVKFFTDILF